MLAFLPCLFNKFFPHLAAGAARRREAHYAEVTARRRHAHFSRPCLEVLEGRIVLNAYTYIGPSGGDWMAPGNWRDQNGRNAVPGSMDTADVPSGTFCVLNSTSPQTVAGLTVEGRLDIGSKLSVTTDSNASGSVFNVLTGGEVDVLGSADLGGGGTISGQIDSQGSSVTFDPSSSMTAAAGATLSGSLFNIFGGLTVTGALTQNARMVLSNNGSTTSGSLTGPGSMSDGAEFDWDGGAIGLTGSGGAYFGASADLKIEGSDNKLLSAGTLTNQCNGSEIGGTGNLSIADGATFDNIGNPSCDVTISSAR